MAEGLLRALSGGEVYALSAGTERKHVREHAKRAMAQREQGGIDISSHWSKTIHDIDQPVDIVVTVCDSAAEACPRFSQCTKQVHKSFTDPASFPDENDEAKLAAFARVRDEIEQYIREELMPMVRSLQKPAYNYEE